MNANFEEFKKNQKFNRNKRKMNTSERDYFELLSAYLDGEVTASERQQVQHLLDTDVKTQQLYTRLLNLRHRIENLPVPTPEKSAEELSAQVFERIDQRRRRQRLFFVSGAAIAAVIIGVISMWLPGGEAPTPQIAKPPATESDAEPLMIALNRPVVEIPPAARLPKKVQPHLGNQGR